MSPEYLRELADLADPDCLWRLPIFDQMDLSPEKRRRLDMGVALRRHASHVRDVQVLLGTGKSLLITTLSINGTATMAVTTPARHKKLLDARTPRIDPKETKE